MTGAQMKGRQDVWCAKLCSRIINEEFGSLRETVKRNSSQKQNCEGRRINMEITTCGVFSVIARKVHPSLTKVDPKHVLLDPH